ncbi:MAG: lysostaphin resistance A-like protein [Acidiferrobacterales bacterium]
MQENTPTYPPWGIWATIGFSLIIVACFLLVQMLAAVLFVTAKGNIDPDLDPAMLASSLETNGFLLALTTCATMVVTIGLVALFIWFRRQATFKQYLHLSPISAKTLIGWLGVVVLFGIVWDGLTYLLDRPIIPDFMLTAYATAYFAPLLWLAVVIAAPLTEEVFFRGFLFEGIRFSRLGGIGAVLFTSLIWAVIHIQYGLYEISTVFILGIVLGIARLKTQSLYTTIAMHSLANLLATLEVVVYLHYLTNAD